MMIMSDCTPAHKQTDPRKRPGQIVNDVTLADYYERKMKTKLTFEEWFTKYNKENGLPPAYIVAVDAWNAGQENV